MCSSGIVNILSLAKKSFGTGFFISPDGYILTCKHVLTKAGYKKIGEKVILKFAESDAVFEAKWINNSSLEDLAILHTIISVEKFFYLSDKITIGSLVESFGFPNGSFSQIKATVTIEQLMNKGKHIQLGNANTITFGFSGAPIVCNEAVIGVISGVTANDKNGRLSNIALAISAKCVLEEFPKFTKKKELCIGYGDKENVCTAFAISKGIGFCEECFTKQFKDSVKGLYEAQNYCIHHQDGFFVAELKYGVSKYYDAIFCIVKFEQQITKDDLLIVYSKAIDSQYNISQIGVVTNTQLTSDARKYSDEKNILIKSKEELLRSLFDFEPYRKDLQKKANSEQLAGHYIEVFGTGIIRKNKEKSIDELELVDEDFYFEDEAMDEYLEYYDDLDDSADEDLELDDEDLALYENFEDEDTQSNHCEKRPKMPLREYVDNFLTSKHKALLILGDYGSGKTSFCYTYALDLLKKYINENSPYLPLLIKLRSYNKAVGVTQLLTDYFVNTLGISNFNISSLKLMLNNLNVLLIFDGYDEVAKKVDFDIKYEVLKEICNLAEGNTKIIVTCRPNYFQNESEFKQIFQDSHLPYEPGEQPLIEFIENTIAELTPAQIETYIESYQGELEKANVSIQDMLDSIANTHDLTDLSKRPFLLYMILSTLPKILAEEKEKKHKKINASRLYEVYTNSWIRREDSKNKTLIKQADKQLFCKELAYELYCSDADSLSYKAFPSTIKKHFKYIDRIEDIDYFSHDIQSCSFLTSDRTGEFKFIHKSFMEYFVADRIVCKLSEKIERIRNKQKIPSEINNILGSTYLSMEICLFINDMLDSPKHRNSINKAKEYFDKLSNIAQSNILSIIAKTDINMADFFLQYHVTSENIRHVDLSYAKFKGRIISNISFGGQHFYSTFLERMTFVNCDFSGAAFDKATLKNVNFYNCRFHDTKWREKTLLTNCAFGEEEIEAHFLYRRETDVSYIEKVADLLEGSSSCDLQWSIWKDATVESCSFYEGSFGDAIMRSVVVSNSTFIATDFSGIKLKGRYEFDNNKLIDVVGAPYEIN